MKATSVEEAMQTLDVDLVTDIDTQSTAGGPCDTDLRTTTVNLNNLSSWTVEIAFFHLQSLRVSNLPPNYSKNTGVFVAAQEVGPNRTSPEVDTCLVGGRNRPIAADWFDRGCKLRIVRNGQTYHHETKATSTVPIPGNYWKGGTVTIRDTPALMSAEGPPVPELVFTWDVSDLMPS